MIAHICFIDYRPSLSDQTSAPEEKWCCKACRLGSAPGMTPGPCQGLQESVGVGRTQRSCVQCPVGVVDAACAGPEEAGGREAGRAHAWG